MPFLLFNKTWKNPVIFGAAIYSHPIECPALLSEYPNVQKVLVPGEWMRYMFEPYYPNKTVAWPAGIDTHKWSPEIKESLSVDFLIYDKIRWEHASYQGSLIDPICQTLANRGLSFEFIRYGHYRPEDLLNKIKHARAVIFLCEHETQGLAYQQILATGTPILAWERGGYWQDPYYFPHKAMFEPVSATPYWDERCGLKFHHMEEFEDRLSAFMGLLGTFHPEEYVRENLSLEISAQKYLDIYNEVLKSLS
jgi:hypothetical protein